MLNLVLLLSSLIIPDPKDTTDLRKLENLDSVRRIILIRKILNPTFPQVSGSFVEEFIEENFSDFYFVDIDNDEDRDIIYTGWWEGESKSVKIFINKNDKYRAVFDQDNQLTEAKFKDKKLSALVLKQSYCCDYYIRVYEQWDFETQKDSVRSKMIIRTERKDITPMPSESFNAPVNIETVSDETLLHGSWDFDALEKTESWKYNWRKDYSVRGYKKGHPGIGLGKQLDKNGEEWWYVQMQPLPEEYSEWYEPTHMLGWFRKSEFRIVK